MRVLIVMVESLAIHEIVAHLKAQGHMVERASTPHDASQLLAHFQPECIISDLVGGMKGLSEDQKRRAKGLFYQFAGWIWVTEEVLPRHPELEDRIIFYSADFDEFHHKFENADMTKVKMVSMNPATRRGGGVKVLHSLVEEVARLPPINS